MTKGRKLAKLHPTPFLSRAWRYIFPLFFSSQNKDVRSPAEGGKKTPFIFSPCHGCMYSRVRGKHTSRRERKGEHGMETKNEKSESILFLVRFNTDATDPSHPPPFPVCSLYYLMSSLLSSFFSLSYYLFTSTNQFFILLYLRTSLLNTPLIVNKAHYLIWTYEQERVKKREHGLRTKKEKGESILFSILFNTEVTDFSRTLLSSLSILSSLIFNILFSLFFLSYFLFPTFSLPSLSINHLLFLTLFSLSSLSLLLSTHYFFSFFYFHSSVIILFLLFTVYFILHLLHFNLLPASILFFFPSTFSLLSSLQLITFHLIILT